MELKYRYFVESNVLMPTYNKIIRILPVTSLVSPLIEMSMTGDDSLFRGLPTYFLSRWYVVLVVLLRQLL